MVPLILMPVAQMASRVRAGAGRSGLQVSEERPGPSADLPPVGTSRRGAYPDRVPGGAANKFLVDVEQIDGTGVSPTFGFAIGADFR
jgi:hypothetical protein